MAENKLSWTELRRALASRAGVSEKEANAFLSAFNAQLIEALKADKQVKINGLGTFKLQALAPRKSVNVKTGEEITIEGYNKISFVPEAGVKELVESNGERRMANGEQTDNASKQEVDPLKKLGAQAEEIVDILGELGQSPNGESNQPSEVSIQPEPAKPQEEPVKEPEMVVAPTPEPTPTPSPVPAKPKKKYHFLRDTLICVVILLALLFAGYFFLRHQLSSWIDGLVNKTEVVVEAKSEGLEAKGEGLEAKGEGLMAKVEEWFAKGKGLMVKGEGLEAKGEGPVEIEEEPQPVVEEPVVEEPKPTVKAEPYQELLLTEEITYGSRLAWIAKKYYGDKAYWPYLYDANRDRITNPSAIPVGTQIRVPKLSAAQRDTTSAAFQALKEEAYSAAR